MTGRTHNRSMLTLFEQVGTLYAGPMRLTWARPSRTPPVQHGLELFLGSYAFERAGAAPNYAPAAVRAVHANAGHLTASAVWKSFAKLADGRVNEKLNPLSHRVKATCCCTLCVLADDDGKPLDLIAHFRGLLEKGLVGEAHQQLMTIRGIGTKIASFFLRDLAIWFDLDPDTDRALLQPIDLWVRRFVGMLDPTATVSDAAVTDWIIDHSARPELLNAGMWFFGARIAPARLVHEAALADPRYARQLVERYVERITLAAAAWNDRT